MLEGVEVMGGEEFKERGALVLEETNTKYNVFLYFLRNTKYNVANIKSVHNF